MLYIYVANVMKGVAHCGYVMIADLIVCLTIVSQWDRRSRTRKRDNDVFRCRMSVHKRCDRRCRTGALRKLEADPCLANLATLTPTQIQKSFKQNNRSQF